MSIKLLKSMRNCPYCGSKLDKNDICQKCLIKFQKIQDPEYPQKISVEETELTNEPYTIDAVAKALLPGAQGSVWPHVIYYALAGAFILLGSFFSDPNLFWFGASGFGLKAISEAAGKILKRN